MRSIWNRASMVWCRVFHPKPFWPIHGYYRCPACLRLYPVPWEEGDHAASRGFSETCPNRPAPLTIVAISRRCQPGGRPIGLAS